MKKNLIVVFLALLELEIILLVTSVEQGEAFDCNDTKTSMMPCVLYLNATYSGTGGESGHDPLPLPCCDALSGVKSSTPDRDDRIAACECLKEIVGYFSGEMEFVVATLPRRCGVDIGFPITKYINCEG